MEMLILTKEELLTLNKIVEDWLGEGFVSNLPPEINQTIHEMKNFEN
jgi:hypothetical protein